MDLSASVARQAQLTSRQGILVTGTQVGSIAALAHLQADDIILKVDELNKQKTPVEVILKEGRARILQEKIIREGNRLRELLTIAGSDDELDRLSSKIGQLKYLETALLPNAKSEEELDDVKRKIETIMSVIGQSENVETRA